MSKDVKPLGNCPDCGKNMDMVGKAHICIPVPRPPLHPPMRDPDHTPRKLRGYGSMKGQLAVRKDIDLTKPIHAQAEKGIRVKDLQKRVALPPASPDCKRCAERARRQKEIMRKRRGK